MELPKKRSGQKTVERKPINEATLAGGRSYHPTFSYISLISIVHDIDANPAKVTRPVRWNCDYDTACCSYGIANAEPEFCYREMLRSQIVSSPPSMGACEESMDSNNNLHNAASSGAMQPSPGIAQSSVNIDTYPCFKEVFLGQKEFETFDEFSQLFSRFEKRSRFLFRVKNSSSVEAENRRRKDQIDSAIKYSGLVLCCVNSELGHGKPSNRSGQCKAHIYLRYRSQTRRLAIMTATHIHNHPQEEGASLNTRICVTERLGRQDRLAPRRKGARSSKPLLSSVMPPHSSQFVGRGRSFGLSSNSPPETVLSTPSASPPVPLDLRAGSVPGGVLSHPFLSGLPFLLPGAGHLNSDAFLSRLIQAQGGISGALSGVVPSSTSPSEFLAQMRVGSPLHGSGLVPPFSPDSLLGQRLSSFRPFVGAHAPPLPDESAGTSRAFSPGSLPPHLQSHFSHNVQNGITPPRSVSNGSNPNSTASGVLEPECLLRTTEAKRQRLSPCGSETSTTTSMNVVTSNGFAETRSFDGEADIDVSDASRRSPRTRGADDEEVTLVQDLSTKSGLSRRASSASSPVEVPVSPVSRTSASSPIGPEDQDPPTNQQPVSIIVRTGSSEYELRWEQLESLFRLCAKCGGGVDEISDSDHGAKSSTFNGVSSKSVAAINGSIQGEAGPITVETLCQLARRQRDHSHPDPYNSER
ncbi:uncharacterized protein LOC100902320 [Galendromus occidentalis]|uniref:Uncharacterized protein LOC100902320 n=1 Tax=Galendromus occidentalis TaxID=34638 RepID=A0AAJ7WI92_9ACAR|nr:uncharacterized protein LOC100902320 [Galendromus occidentalis]